MACCGADVAGGAALCYVVLRENWPCWREKACHYFIFNNQWRLSRVTQAILLEIYIMAANDNMAISRVICSRAARELQRE